MYGGYGLSPRTQRTQSGLRIEDDNFFLRSLSCSPYQMAMDELKLRHTIKLNQYDFIIERSKFVTCTETHMKDILIYRNKNYSTST